MLKTFLTNAFSINMLPGRETEVDFYPLTTEEAHDILVSGFESAIGHKDTAAVVSQILGIKVSVNRVDVKLNPDVQIIVAQYTGPRLPEGVTTLPDGAKIEFWQVI